MVSRETQLSIIATGSKGHVLSCASLSLFNKLSNCFLSQPGTATVLVKMSFCCLESWWYPCWTATYSCAHVCKSRAEVCVHQQHRLPEACPIYLYFSLLFKTLFPTMLRNPTKLHPVYKFWFLRRTEKLNEFSDRSSDITQFQSWSLKRDSNPIDTLSNLSSSNAFLINGCYWSSTWYLSITYT